MPNNRILGLSDMCNQWDGLLDKFIGDGVTAYFGYYDNAGNQTAINAMNAAIELKEKFIIIKNEWIKESNLNPKKVEINVECGIHTDLLFGIIDTEYRNGDRKYSKFRK